MTTTTKTEQNINREALLSDEFVSENDKYKFAQFYADIHSTLPDLKENQALRLFSFVQAVKTHEIEFYAGADVFHGDYTGKYNTVGRMYMAYGRLINNERILRILHEGLMSWNPRFSNALFSHVGIDYEIMTPGGNRINLSYLQ